MKINLLADELKRISRGELIYDKFTLNYYSVDSSHFSIKPDIIVYPEDTEDVKNICFTSFSKNLSITCRGAGTGLAGQSLNSGIIMDFTKKMNKILEIENDYIIVQPGAPKAIIDQELSKRGKFLPPDPASSNYCTIGGMISNNSSGIHTLGYGSIIDFLKEIEIIYSDGTSSILSGMPVYNKNKQLMKDPKVSELYNIISDNIMMIEKNYPKVSKNSCGYRLDSIINNSYFHPQKLMCSSEGTLSIFSSAKLKVIDIPEFQATITIGFKNIIEAMKSVPIILKLYPAAIEALDETVIRINKIKDQIDKNNKNNYYEIGRNEGCLFFIEFMTNNKSLLNSKIEKLKEKMEDKGEILEIALDNKSSTDLWTARKNALNSVMKLTIGSRKPLGIIEDTVVNPYILPDFITYLINIYNQFKLEYVFYGHAGNGNLHTRPIIDILDKRERNVMNILAKNIFEYVISSKGSITGEHGDGLSRIGYIELQYGKDIMKIFRKIKKVFDPKNVLNPNKKIID